MCIFKEILMSTGLFSVAAMLSSPAIALEPAQRAAANKSEDRLTRTTVCYGDLDLRVLGDQRALDTRVARAVHSLCHISMSTIPLQEYVLQRECTRATLADVRPHVAAAIKRAGSGGHLAAVVSRLTIALRR
jgi:UrcA family protein